MRLRPAWPLAAVAAGLFATSLSAQPGPAASSPPWSVQGRLEEGDRQDTEEHRYDDFRLRLEAGQRYRLSADSDDFDTLIQLYPAGGEDPVAQNDDFDIEHGLNSRVTYVPQESGDYVLRVMSFSAEGRGAYAAGAEVLPPLPAPITARPSSRPRLRWGIWEGELSATDPERDGGHFDDYLVPMRAGETRLIAAESGDFDALIWVLRADGREGEPLEIEDDAGPGLNALLGFRPEDDGDYIVRVTSYGSGGRGAYRLRISEPLVPAPPADMTETQEPMEEVTPPPQDPADATSGASAGR